jgi:hypothetical protein
LDLLWNLELGIWIFGFSFSLPSSPFLQSYSVNPLWSCLILLTAATSFGAGTNDLIAFFPLRSDARDTFSKSPPMELTNAPFVNGVLYLNGIYQPYKIGSGYYGPAELRGYHAVASVPGLNYASFTISFDFFPLKTKHGRRLRGFEAKLNDWTRGYYSRWLVERSGPPDNFLTGGTWYRWLGFNPGTNGLELTLNNQTFRHQFKGSIVRVGQWHNLICSLDLQRKQIITILDGHTLETVNLPQDFRFEVVSTERESGDKELAFVNYSNGKVFNGYAAHLRVFSRALSASEMAGLYSEWALERKSLPALVGTGNRIFWFLLLIVIVGIFLLVRKTSQRTNPTDTPASDTREQ